MIFIFSNYLEIDRLKNKLTIFISYMSIISTNAD